MRCVLLVGMLGACALDGPQTRARIDDEPAGENCEQGGLAVRTGLDVDEDKYVDDDELTAESYLCHREQPKTCDDSGKVLRGRVVLATLEDEDKLDGVTCIEGDLVIASNTAFEILGTSHLHTVYGHVAIAGNPSLQTLDGLDALRTVDSVLIQGNDGLISLAPLSRLAHGEIAITANDYLTDLHGLEEMTAAPGDISITGNPELQSLLGLDQLTTASAISIRSNAQLRSIEALAHLSASGNLMIADNPELSEIALPSLATVDGQLSITSSRALRRLTLPSLSEVRTSVIVADDVALDEIQLPALRSTGRLMIRNNPSVGAVRAPILETVNGGIELSAMARLTLVDLKRVGFLDGFLKLDTLGLTDLTGFEGLYELQDLRVTENAQLSSFDGLASLAVVDGSFVVRGSETLKKGARLLAERIEIRGAIGID